MRRAGRRVLKQRKTGAVVMLPDAPELAARLAAARRRRESSRVVCPEVIVDSRTGRPYGHRTDYSHQFAAVRAAAVASVKDATSGAVIVPASPSLTDARDQDLRDTAVTWLARAGCKHMEIAAISGHKPETIHGI